MDNELDGRLRRLEAGQADQSEQLSRLLDGQERIHRTLTELARLMTEPDDDAVLHSVLASLVRAIEANTSTLNDLAQNFSRKP
jgi:hypothetical protein